MKVALLSYAFAEYCIQQANGLVDHAEVLLMLPESEAADHANLVRPQVDFRPFDKPKLLQPVRQISAAARLVRQIRRFKPDVVHIQHGHLWFNAALPWLRKFPLVMTIHDPRHHVGDRASRKTPQAWMDFGFRRADRVIVHGELLKQQVCEAMKISSSRIHVIPHVAIGQVDSATPPAKTAQQILFFGRIWKYKGLDYLIRAQPQISAAFPDAQIIIAGTGEDLEPYRRQMVDPTRFVIHDRYISVDERDALFRQASIVVLPYIEATQSGVIPLAYSFGVPVVASNTGALSEAVEHGETGFLVPPADSTALANAVIELLSDPARCQSMGAAGRRKLDAQCAPSVVARQTMDVYQRTIRDRRGAVRTSTSAAGSATSVEDAICDRLEPVVRTANDHNLLPG